MWTKYLNTNFLKHMSADNTTIFTDIFFILCKKLIIILHLIVIKYDTNICFLLVVVL